MNNIIDELYINVIYLIYITYFRQLTIIYREYLILIFQSQFFSARSFKRNLVGVIFLLQISKFYFIKYKGNLISK